MSFLAQLNGQPYMASQQNMVGQNAQHMAQMNGQPTAGTAHGAAQQFHLSNLLAERQMAQATQAQAMQGLAGPAQTWAMASRLRPSLSADYNPEVARTMRNHAATMAMLNRLTEQFGPQPMPGEPQGGLDLSRPGDPFFGGPQSMLPPNHADLPGQPIQMMQNEAG